MLFSGDINRWWWCPTSIAMGSSVSSATSVMVESVRVPFGGARGVMVILVGNGHGDVSSNPGRDWWHFTKH